MLAAVGVGLYPDLNAAAAAMRGEITAFIPQMAAAEREPPRQDGATRWGGFEHPHRNSISHRHRSNWGVKWA
jgi:hypothetical protein